MKSNGNITIAQFMGWKFSKSGKTARRSNGNERGVPYRITDIHYDTHWGWLMEGVDEIVKYQYEDGTTAFLRTFGMQDEDGLFMVRFNRMFLHKGKTLFEATFNAVKEWAEYELETRKLEANQ